MSALSLPSAPNISDPVSLLADPARVARVGAKAYARIVQAWGLDNAAAAGLIGVSARTWTRIKQGEWTGRFSQDQQMRLSAIVGLYKALHLYFSEPLADEWVSLPNTAALFAGRAPVQFMAAGGLPALIDTRNYMDALRGGV